MTAPCPFCGGAGYISREDRAGYADYPDDPDRFAYSVVCRSCAAVGPWHKSETAAEMAWDRRHAPRPEEAPRG